MAAHHDPLANESDLLTLTEALVRIEDEIDQLRCQLEDVDHDDPGAADHGRHRLATLEDAAERYRRLVTPESDRQPAATPPS